MYILDGVDFLRLARGYLPTHEIDHFLLCYIPRRIMVLMGFAAITLEESLGVQVTPTKRSTLSR